MAVDPAGAYVWVWLPQASEHVETTTVRYNYRLRSVPPNGENVPTFSR